MSDRTEAEQQIVDAVLEDTGQDVDVTLDLPDLPAPLFRTEYTYKAKDGDMVTEEDLPQVGDMRLFPVERGVVAKVAESRKDGQPFFQITIEG